MNANKELKIFNSALSVILGADPKVVKAAMEADKKAREEQRNAKRASAVPASSGKG